MQKKQISQWEENQITILAYQHLVREGNVNRFASEKGPMEFSARIQPTRPLLFTKDETVNGAVKPLHTIAKLNS